MSRFTRLTVRTRLIGCFLIVSALAAIIGIVGMRSMGRINTMADIMYEQELKGIRHAAAAQMNLVATGRAIRSTLLTQTNEAYRNEFFQIDNHFNLIALELNNLLQLARNDKEKANVQQVIDAVALYDQEVHKLVTEDPSKTLGRLDATDRLFDTVRPAGDKAEAMLEMLVANREGNAMRYANEISEIHAATLNVMIGLTLGGAVIAILLGWASARSLMRQLGGEPGDVARIAGAIAQGDLSSDIETRASAAGSVMQAMRLMQESLRTVVARVRNSSDHIAAGSSEIAAGNADLSHRTDTQAANLTETASAMEELAGTVRNNAEVAQEAARMARSANDAALKGGEATNNVVTTMTEIHASSGKIVEIISVIDSIAFQTNILALNAAVEAARAGEQGRGFAVVASEVRSLAQKSATAAHDIKQLIDDSVRKVEAGSQMVDIARAAMQDIVAHVKSVSDLIQEISAATAEQTSGLAQINEAVMQLSDATQQNASLVEQSAAAADSLNEQALELVQAVSVFQLHDDNDAHSQAAALIERAAQVTPEEIQRARNGMLRS